MADDGFGPAGSFTDPLLETGPFMKQPGFIIQKYRQQRRFVLQIKKRSWYKNGVDWKCHAKTNKDHAITSGKQPSSQRRSGSRRANSEG
jgi:hypothetical protein